VLTTPFSYVATTSSLAWEGLEPAFIDIDPRTFNIDPAALEAAEPGSGIVAVHVFGNPCDVEALERIGAERDMPVIYDAAHAFGSTYRGRSLLRWGDAATLSFHATKIFHTVEGGGIVFRERAKLEEAKALMNFGQGPAEAIGIAGTNAKLSEYHVAAGLTLLDEMPRVMAHRAELAETYIGELSDWVGFQGWSEGGRNNGAYMPILLSDEAQCLRLKAQLQDDGVETRRYFYPSLNRLGWGRADSCPVSEDIASRILCLPLYADLRIDEAREISEKVKAALASGNRPAVSSG
jgi:dTDP-4-amino-4,6-dideoxygalactose transaminase